MTDISKWKVQGDWFDTCSCSIPCPCTFAQPPTNDNCEGILAWHLRQGNYGNVRLDAENEMARSTCKGNLCDERTKASMAMYVDDHADWRQHQELQRICCGRVDDCP